MQAVARRQVDASVEALLWDRLDIDQIKRVELVRPLRFDKDVDVAAGACEAAGGRSEQVEGADPMGSNLRQTALQLSQNLSLFNDLSYAIAFFRFASTLSRKASVESHF